MVDKAETKNPVGRPPFYKTEEELQAAIDEYFSKAVVGQYTITGLALSLGFTSRLALLNYEDKPELVNAVKTAKLRIEQDYEQSLRDKGRSGDIFGLKNFGWKDAQDHNMGGQNGTNPMELNASLKINWCDKQPEDE